MDRIFTIIAMYLFWLQKTNSQDAFRTKQSTFKLSTLTDLFDNYVQYLQDVREGMLCAMLCVEAPDCASFAHQQDNKECFLYNRIVKKDDSKKGNTSVNTSNYFLKNTNDVTIQGNSVQSTTDNDNIATQAVDRHTGTKSLTLEEENPWWCTDLEKIYSIKMIIIDTDSSLVPQYDVRFRLDNECSSSGLETSSICNSIGSNYTNGSGRFGFTITNCTGLEMKATSIYITTNRSEPTSLALYSVYVFPELSC